jgi:hypothetical protein
VKKHGHAHEFASKNPSGNVRVRVVMVQDEWLGQLDDLVVEWLKDVAGHAKVIPSLTPA